VGWWQYPKGDRECLRKRIRRIINRRPGTDAQRLVGEGNELFLENYAGIVLGDGRQRCGRRAGFMTLVSSALRSARTSDCTCRVMASSAMRIGNVLQNLHIPLGVLELLSDLNSCLMISVQRMWIMSKILMTLAVALFAASSTGCCLMQRDDPCPPPPAVYSPAAAPACGCGTTTGTPTVIPGTISQ